VPFTWTCKHCGNRQENLTYAEEKKAHGILPRLPVIGWQFKVSALASALCRKCYSCGRETYFPQRD
jgi:hypothetical protein